MNKLYHVFWLVLMSFILVKTNAWNVFSYMDSTFYSEQVIMLGFGAFLLLTSLIGRRRLPAAIKVK